MCVLDGVCAPWRVEIRDQLCGASLLLSYLGSQDALQVLLLVCGDSFGLLNHLVGRSFCLSFEPSFFTGTWGSPIMQGEPQGSTSFYFPSAGIKRQSCLTVPLPSSRVGSVYQIHAFTDRAISLAPFHLLF